MHVAKAFLSIRRTGIPTDMHRAATILTTIRVIGSRPLIFAAVGIAAGRFRHRRRTIRHGATRIGTIVIGSGIIAIMGAIVWGTGRARQQGFHLWQGFGWHVVYGCVPFFVLSSCTVPHRSCRIHALAHKLSWCVKHADDPAGLAGLLGKSHV